MTNEAVAAAFREDLREFREEIRAELRSICSDYRKFDMRVTQLEVVAKMTAETEKNNPKPREKPANGNGNSKTLQFNVNMKTIALLVGAFLGTGTIGGALSSLFQTSAVNPVVNTHLQPQPAPPAWLKDFQNSIKSFKNTP